MAKTAASLGGYPPAPQTPSIAPEAIDEAFASLIASQLEALDRQRKQLARLLDGIDA